MVHLSLRPDIHHDKVSLDRRLVSLVQWTEVVLHDLLLLYELPQLPRAILCVHDLMSLNPVQVALHQVEKVKSEDDLYGPDAPACDLILPVQLDVLFFLLTLGVLQVFGDLLDHTQFYQLCLVLVDAE